MSEPSPQPLSDNGRKLLRELNAKISTMETLLGNLHSTESKTGSSFQELKVDLRTRLTACYLARDSLQKGGQQNAGNLEDLLARFRVRVEHQKYREQPVIQLSDVQSVNIDELARRLTA
ncbi:MAG: hypothetical protein ACJAQZ_004288 [Planctomycetota bacterium]|jgi:hypothetical protein